MSTMHRIEGADGRVTWIHADDVRQVDEEPSGGSLITTPRESIYHHMTPDELAREFGWAQDESDGHE